MINDNESGAKMKSRSHRYDTNRSHRYDTNRSHRYDTNRPRPRYGYKYTKYKMRLSIMII